MNSIKRIFVFFVALVCSLSALCVPALANDDVTTPSESTEVKLQLPAGATVSQLCSDGQGGCYLLASSGLYHWTEGAAEAVLLAQPTEEVAGMAAWEGTLYAVGRTHSFLCWQDGAWETLGSNTEADGMVYGAKMAASASQLFYAYRNEDDQLLLYAYDLASHEVKRLQAFDDRMFVYDAMGDVLVSVTESPDKDSGTYALVAYDSQTNTFSQAETIPGLQDGIRGWSYDIGSDVYYFAARNGIMRYRRGGSAEPFTAHQSGIVAALGSDGVALITATDGIWELRVCSQKQTGTVLTVMGYTTSRNAAFHQKSGMTVQVVDAQFGDEMDDLSQAMITQDGRVDLFGIRTGSGLELVKRKGYGVDLQSSSVLLSAARELVPAIASCARDANGTLVAWPVYAEPIYRTVRADVLAQYGFSVPETWSELLDVVPQILDSDLLAEQEMVLFDTLSWTRQDIFPYMVESYLLTAACHGQPADFDTEVFRTLANRILTELPEEDPVPRSEEGTEEALFCMSCAANVIQPDMLPPLRFTQEDAGVFTSVLVLVVNPYSEHRQEAIAYLEYLAAHHISGDYSLYASMTEPEANTTVQALLTQKQQALEKLRAATDDDQEKERQVQEETLQAEIAALEEQQWVVSAETIAQYQHLAESFVIPEEALPTESERLSTLMAMTLERKLSLDDFIRQANTYLWMVEEEAK